MCTWVHPEGSRSGMIPSGSPIPPTLPSLPRSPHTVDSPPPLHFTAVHSRRLGPTRQGESYHYRDLLKNTIRPTQAFLRGLKMQETAQFQNAPFQTGVHLHILPMRPACMILKVPVISTKMDDSFAQVGCGGGAVKSKSVSQLNHIIFKRNGVLLLSNA